jgi:hypothetical protein
MTDRSVRTVLTCRDFQATPCVVSFTGVAPSVVAADLKRTFYPTPAVHTKHGFPDPRGSGLLHEDGRTHLTERLIRPVSDPCRLVEATRTVRVDTTGALSRG